MSSPSIGLVSTSSVVLTAVVLSLVLAVASGAPKKDKDEKKLKHVIITSFGEMPYEPLEGFVQSDVIPVNFQDEEKNPTMDVALRTGILVEDPNEKKYEENSAEGDYYSSQEEGGSDNVARGDRTKKTGEELFREFREKYRYVPKKDTRQYSNTQWSPMIPSAGDGEFLRPREPPAPPPKTEGGYNVDREFHGDLGEGWNLDDAVEILQDRNYNVLTQTPNPATPPPREAPPPLLPPGGAPFYPYPSFPVPAAPFPNFNPHRRSRVYPVYQDPNFYRNPQQPGVNRQGGPIRQEVTDNQFHPTKIGVLYNRPNVYYGAEYLRGV